MEDFLVYIRNISSEDLIAALSKLSIDMFEKNDILTRDVPVIGKQGFRNIKLYLTPWDILDMEFLSIKYSNDYRHTKKTLSLQDLMASYRRYADEQSAKEVCIGDTFSSINRFMLGITAEQFEFQKSQMADTFNRNYHILYAARNYKYRSEFDLNDVIVEVLGLSFDAYVKLMFTLFVLCSHNPDPLSIPESQYRPQGNIILTKDNLLKLVQYYSCTYSQLRSSELGKQLLYSKPFIKTDKSGLFLCSNLYLVAFLVANGLYWIVRDYYNQTNSQAFTNAFGHLFEEYIYEMANKYCKPSQWHKLSESRQKGADFIFDFETFTILLESKSSLLGLPAKQQIPNMQVIDNFMTKTIQEAYTQLESCCNQLKNYQPPDKPILKFILLYDDFSNAKIIQNSFPEIFESDDQCFILTIGDFESLLYISHFDPEKFQNIIANLLNQADLPSHGRNTIDGILTKFNIEKNLFSRDNFNYFKCLLNDISK